MRINYVGIVAGIIAFISLMLPWWTMAISAGTMGFRISADFSVYPYQAKVSATGLSITVDMELWFGWIALALIVIAGIAGIVGSLIVGKTGKTILIIAGILALLSIIIFAVGLQSELSKEAPVSDFLSGLPKVGLFSTGSLSYMGMSIDYSTYLSFGFWLALVAAIIAFISLGKHPMAPPVAPLTPKS